MNHCIALLQKDNPQKKLYWLLFGACNVIIIGLAIAEAKWYYLLIVLAPFFIYCSIKNPFILPFGLYVFLVPFDRILDVIGFAQGATLTKFIGILTILVLSLKGTFEKKIIKTDSASLVLMLFVAYSVLTNVWAIEPKIVLSKMPTLVGLFIFYLVASTYKMREQEFNTLKWCILFGGIMACILTFYSFQSGSGYGHTERATITLQDESINPNFLSFNLLIPMSICIQMMLASTKKAHKAFFLCIFLFILYVIILTGSRKSLVGAAVIISFYITHIKNNKLTFVTIALTGFIVLLSIAPDFVVERIGGSLEDRGAGRLDIWLVGIKALERYWLLGAGFGNFPMAFNEFTNRSAYFVGLLRAAHNLYLQVLVETGVIGLLLLMWSLTKHHGLLKIRLVRDDLNRVMLRASFWSLLAAGLFADILLNKSFWLLFMMMVMYKNIGPTTRLPFQGKRLR